MDRTIRGTKFFIIALLAAALSAAYLPQRAAAQDQDDPPGRVARIGYLQGSVSFNPAGEPDWVGAVPNRPMTTGDQLWADANSRAEVELGYAVIRLAPNTGFSFLNLDDRTTQIQLTSGSLNITVRRLGGDEGFEIDTPNQAFSVYQPGRYRVEASEDGNYTVISVRQGEGESTGNGQTYALHAGERVTFSGTDSLHADAEQIGPSDDFDNWADARDHRREGSRSARYLSHNVVGYEDLDDYGEWRDDSNYGHVWYPTHVSAGWAPYREGHWDWISPWGWTWVDDEPWGYAPYHYGRWVTIGGRWGWVAGPVDVRPVYAPALVVFIGGGGSGFGANVGWFPLGPREVYVPSYRVSPTYMNRVNVSNTTVSSTTITNVYNTTVINKSTTITNITYANRSAPGAVTAVPQGAFVSSQPVAKAVVAVNAKQVAEVPVTARAAVTPTRQSVLGSKASSAGRVAAPPPTVASRPVVAKAAPPPPPVPFEKQQQALAAHPGQPLAKQEAQALRPATPAQGKMVVKLAPPGKPMKPNAVAPGNPNGNSPNAAKPGVPAGGAPAPAARPTPNPPAQPPAKPNGGPEPGRPEPNPPAPAARPAPNPSAQPPAQPNARPEPSRPEPNPPAPHGRPQPGHPAEPPAQPNARPEPGRPEPNPPAPTGRPQPNARPEPSRPEPNPPAPTGRPQPNARPEPGRPEPNPPAPTGRPQPGHPAGPPAQPQSHPPGGRPQPPNTDKGKPPQQNHQPRSNKPQGPDKKNGPDKQNPDDKPQLPL